MPNWTTKVNNVTTVDAAHINDLQKHISWECPEYYGAVGDGVTDDTAAIQAAIDACDVGGTVWLGPKTYRIAGGGDAIVTISKCVNLLGTPGKSYLLGFPSTTTTDVLRIAVDDNGDQGDVRQQLIYGVKCGPSGNGRHGLCLADGTLNQLYFTIDQCHLGGNDDNNGKAISVGSKYAYTTITNNQLEEGVYFETGSGDGQKVVNNLIFGNSLGVVFDLGYGTYSHLVMGNAIVTVAGAIFIINGSQIKIIYNTIEQPSANTGVYNSHIVVGGNTYDSESVEIIGNNLGGGSNVNNIITALNCHHLVIEHNHINKSVVWDVNYANSNCTLNRFGRNNLMGYGRANSYDPNINDNGSNNSVFTYAEHWSGTSSQYMRGDKTWQKLDKEAVSGIGKADIPSFANVKLSGLTTSYLPYATEPVEKITDGGMEAWDSSTTLTNWGESISGTSTVNRESAEQYAGSYCARLDVDASNSDVFINAQVELSVGELYKLSFYYKTEAGKTANLQINDIGLHQYLTSSSTWSTSLTAISLPAATDWTEFTLTFYPHESYADYYVYFANNSAASSSLYFDSASLVEYQPFSDSPISTDGVDVTISGDLTVEGSIAGSGSVPQPLDTDDGPTFDHLHITNDTNTKRVVCSDGSHYLRVGGYGSAALVPYISTDAAHVGFLTDGGGSIPIKSGGLVVTDDYGDSAGTSATSTIVIKNGAAPASSGTNTTQLYSADQTAGNACLHIRTEDGSVVKLFQNTAVADATNSTDVVTRLNELLVRCRMAGFIAS